MPVRYDASAGGGLSFLGLAPVFLDAASIHQPELAMALTAYLPNLDGLSEQLAAFYVTSGDGYILDIAPAEGFALENVSGLKSSLAKERQNARKANDLLTKFGDMDADEALAALDKVADMANWKPEDKVREQMAAHEKQWQAKHAKEMEKIQGEANDLRTSLERELIDGAATKAINGAEGSVELLLPHVKAQTSLALVDGKYVVQVMGEDGVPRVSMKPGSTDSMSVGELVESMRDMDSFAPAFAGSGASGSGAASSRAAGSGRGAQSLSWDEAHNPQAYRDAKAAAEKAGSEVHIGEYPQG